MINMPRFASTGARMMIVAAAIPVMLAAGTPAAARQAAASVETLDGTGSANPSFRRHFWRGQLNHGVSASEGYAVYDPASGLHLDADG